MNPHNMPQAHVSMRYSPRPLSKYERSWHDCAIGPATSSLLASVAAWNLAYLSYDYERSLQHPDPQFTVHVHRSVQCRLDGTGQDLGMDASPGVVGSLLHLPAPRFVFLIMRHPLLTQLPMYQAYGAAWLKTIEERSYLCQVEEFQADPIKDLSLARSAIQSSSLGAKFRSSFE